MRAPLRGVALVCTGSVLAIASAGCGGSQSSSDTTTSGAAVATTGSTPTATAPAPPRPAPHLRIASPRRGAQITQTLTVRVSLSGAPANGPQAFKYLLDGRLTRLGSTRLTFHDLAPGHHRLLVALASHPSVRAAVTFVVMAPAPVVAPSPAPVTASPPPPPPPPAPTPSSGIPQGPNAGDADADNNGAPSDGDGNI